MNAITLAEDLAVQQLTPLLEQVFAQNPDITEHQYNQYVEQLVNEYCVSLHEAATPEEFQQEADFQKDRDPEAFKLLSGLASSRGSRFDALRREAARQERIGTFGPGLLGKLRSMYATLKAGSRGGRYYGVSRKDLLDAASGVDPEHYEGSLDQARYQRAKQMSPEEQAVRMAAFAKANRIDSILRGSYERPQPLMGYYKSQILEPRVFPYTGMPKSTDYAQTRAYARELATRAAQEKGLARETTVDGTVTKREIPIMGTSSSPKPDWIDVGAMKAAQQKEAAAKAAKAAREAERAAKEAERAAKAAKAAASKPAKSRKKKGR